MKRNMGTADRLIRTLVVAPVAIIAGIVVGGVGGIVLFVVAAIMLATSAVGSCPLYLPFGLSTCRTKGGGAEPRMS